MRGGYFMNISHLVEKIKKGDNKSFEKLYKLTEREVWFTCISFLKNETTAQDIMQETYITAFLKIQSLEKSSQIRSWLNRIAVNKCKNYLKGKGEIQLDDEIFENQAIVDERISIPEEYISDKAKREIILSIMQEVLSDVQYQTVIMHYFNEMTVDEIAEVFECSRGTVLSRLNYSRAKMKTAIEDYENKSGDKLHGVVFVPFFTTIFREQAKSLKVPSITIKLPNGQTLATSATKGFATGAKSTVSSIVKATATATVKTKVIAVVCGATILAGTSAVGISILAGCNAEKEPTEPSVISSTVQTSTVSPEVSKAIEDNGLKIDKDGNITDKNGKKVEVKDGKVEITSKNGKKIKVDADEIKSANNIKSNTTNKSESNNSSQSSKAEKKNNSSLSSKSENSKSESKKSDSSSNSKSESSKSDSKKDTSSSSKAESSKPESSKSEPKPTQHTHSWKDITKATRVKVVDQEAYTYEEPVYEKQGRYICKACGADITDNLEHIFECAESHDGKASYKTVSVKVQVGTKTITVPEKSHYENKTKVVGRKCSGCGKVEYY
jgi:RNA polymerase sigma factor (sigma-70 family)